jgi:hypothetical protein
MTFAKSFISGRFMMAPMRELYTGNPSGPLTDSMAEAISMLKHMTLTSKPRLVKLRGRQVPVILYTDGAVEQGECACGAVLCDSDGTNEFFMYQVKDPFTSAWSAAGIRHAVAQTEMLPVIMAKMLWKERLRDRPVLFFTDNEVVREALISGSSRNYATNDLLYANAQMDADLQARFWVARVPSRSNPADAPSRFVPDELTKWLGAFCVSPLVPSLSASGRCVVPGLFDPLAEPATNF